MRAVRLLSMILWAAFMGCSGDTSTQVNSENSTRSRENGSEASAGGGLDSDATNATNATNATTSGDSTDLATGPDAGTSTATDDTAQST